MSDYLPLYIEEVGSELEELVQALIDLELHPDDATLLNESFRITHSIKGAAGMMGYDSISELAHKLEDLFDDVRSGRHQLAPPEIDASLLAADVIGAHLRNLAEHGTDDTDATGAIAALQLAVAGGGSGDGGAPEPVLAPPDADAVAAPIPVAGAGDRLLVVEFAPDLPLADLKARAILTHVAEVTEVRSFDPKPDDGDDIGALTIVVGESGTDEELVAAADFDGVVSARVEVGTLPAPPVADEVAAEPADGPDAQVADEAAPPPEPGGPDAAEEEPVPAAAPAAASPAGSAAAVSRTTRIAVSKLDELLNLAGELVTTRARFDEVGGAIRGAVRGRPPGERLREICGRLEELRELTADGEASRLVLSAELREIADVVESVVEQISAWERRAAAAGEIDDALDHLGRISDNFQDSVMEMRMVPLAPLFNRYHRLVRDAARATGKEVELRIRGEATELDKGLADELGEPLTHLIRNSIDHGLEPPGERRALGKSPAGVISLVASHRGNSVYIEVSDDGRGIDAAKIRERLISRNLLDPAAARSLADDEAVEWILQPGFSTATEVTDLSGRGVGLDAVRARITSLSGSLDIDTELGAGTTFRLRLPLTLAIVGSLVVRVSEHRFGIPVEEVQEIVRIRTDDVVSVEDMQSMHLRGEFLPLVDPEHLLGYPVEPGARVADGAHVVVLLTDAGPLGLLIDEPVGTTELVIKSLADNFVPITGLSGASLLGDGTICLMLDVASLAELAVAKPERLR